MKAQGAAILNSDADLNPEGTAIMDRTVGDSDLRREHAAPLVNEITDAYSNRAILHYQQDQLGQGDEVAQKADAMLNEHSMPIRMGGNVMREREATRTRVKAREGREAQLRDEQRARGRIVAGDAVNVAQRWEDDRRSHVLGVVGEQVGRRTFHLSDEISMKINSYLPQPRKKEDR